MRTLQKTPQSGPNPRGLLLGASPAVMGLVRGFTLIEVLIALAIVSVALTAGLRATGTLSLNAQRQTEVMLAQICANNALIEARLSSAYPGPGESEFNCTQGEMEFRGVSRVAPTPNPNFRRIDVQVFLGERPITQFSSIIGKI